MKKLIWKELMEQRLIPVAYAALAALALAMWVSFDHFQNQKDMVSDPREVVMVFVCGVFISGLFSGSSAIAPEVGQGTLKFLTSLPMERGRIWWAKLFSSLMTAVLSILLMAATLSVLGLCVFGLRFGDIVTKPDWVNGVGALLVILGMFTVFSVSLLVSTLVDSSLIATVMSAVSSITLFLIYLGIGTGVYDWSERLLQDASQTTRDSFQQHSVIWMGVLAVGLALACLAACLLGSYHVFCRGGTLRTRKRFGIAALSMGGWVVLVAVVVSIFCVQSKQQIDYYNFLDLKQSLTHRQLDLGQQIIGTSEQREAELGPLPDSLVPHGTLHAVVDGSDITVTKQPYLKEFHYKQFSKVISKYIVVPFTLVAHAPVAFHSNVIEVRSEHGEEVGQVAVEAHNVLTYDRNVFDENAPVYVPNGVIGHKVEYTVSFNPPHSRSGERSRKSLVPVPSSSSISDIKVTPWYLKTKTHANSIAFKYAPQGKPGTSDHQSLRLYTASGYPYAEIKITANTRLPNLREEGSQ